MWETEKAAGGKRTECHLQDQCYKMKTRNLVSGPKLPGFGGGDGGVLTHIGCGKVSRRPRVDPTGARFLCGWWGLVVLGLEIRGRFSAKTATFLRLLAKTRAQGAPQQLGASAVAAYIARWSALLSAAASRTFAVSLLFEDFANHSNIDTSLPELSDLLPQCPEPPAHSRLPSH